MVRLSWKVYTCLVLIGSSLLLFGLHTILFEDPKTLLFYLALDIVFVPIQVLLVTVIIERLLSERERQALIKKLNMVIGAFFSEVGYDLLGRFLQLCSNSDELAPNLAVSSEWGSREYKLATQFAANCNPRFAIQKAELEALHTSLVSKRGFILGMLQNPNLLEHGHFTELLWAICHLTEELDARSNIPSLPQSDITHLGGDIRRAFGMLVQEWLSYMQHLEANYPYMHSLSMRTNPFNPSPTPLINEE